MRRMKKKPIIFATAGIVICLALASFIYIMQIPKFTQEEIGEICTELDYAGLTVTVESFVKEIEDTYLFDADHDGQKELFIRNTNTIYEDKDTVFAFETADHPLFASAVQFGAAGFTDIIEHEGELQLSWGYASIGTALSCTEEWTDTGWSFLSEETLDIESLEDETSDDEDVMQQEADIGQVGYQTLTSKYFEVRNVKDILEAIDVHMGNLEDVNVVSIKEDIDEDGKEEYVYMVSDFAKSWFRQATYTGTDEELMMDWIAEQNHFGTVVYFVDTTWNSIVIQTMYVEQNLADAEIVKISYEDNQFSLLATDGTEAIRVYQYFANAKDYKKVNKGNRKAWKKMVHSFEEFLEANYYREVSIQYADICEAEGNEIICICKEDDVDKVRAYAFCCGKPILLYEQEEPRSANGIGAVYLTKHDGKEKLLLYMQGTFRSFQREATSYDYSLVDYDAYYLKNESNRNYTQVWDDEVPDENTQKYYAGLKEMLSNVVVCNEPYDIASSDIFTEYDLDKAKDIEPKEPAIRSVKMWDKFQNEGVCCTFIQAPDDIESKLTNYQKEMLLSVEKSECCDSVEEARQHISRYISGHLQRIFDVKVLLQDGKSLYVVKGAKGYVSHDYDNYNFEDLGNGMIRLEAVAFDDFGEICNIDTFTMIKTKECYKIVAVETDRWY